MRNEASGGAEGQGSMGDGQTERRETKADRDRDRGSLSLSEIAVAMRREARVLGEVVATKPAWKRRRASENDDELLQLLAEGLGQWIATHKEAPEH